MSRTKAHKNGDSVVVRDVRTARRVPAGRVVAGKDAKSVRVYDVPDMDEVEARLAQARKVMAKPLDPEVRRKLKSYQGPVACGPKR